ncbi:MAG TPA: DUF805 domain-containing protein [Candidatus Competibacter sp.]|nr:DUF805 domain-containing protein [Candidatus Competibacter sp.]
MNQSNDIGNSSPYRPLRSAIAPAPPAAYGEIKVFSVRGRLGRVRYIGYAVGLGWLLSLAGGLLGETIAPLESNGGSQISLAGGAFVVLALAISVLLTVQRLHDFDARGWWVLLVLVPPVNLAFCLALLIVPGTQGSNRLGNPPPPNTAGAIILALVLPMAAVAAVVAAVAMPAYRHYLERAPATGQP